METILIPIDLVINYIFSMYVKSVLLVASGVNAAAFVVFFATPGGLFVNFLCVVLTQRSSKYYWRRFQEDFVETTNKCLTDESFVLFARTYVTGVGYMLFVLTILMVTGILLPEEGQSVREKFSLSHGNAAMIFCTMTLLTMMLKAGAYTMAGIIRSPLHFTFKMLLW